jgi:sn-glycerol 3-phosphate transport system substrate-binding protein
MKKNIVRIVVSFMLILGISLPLMAAGGSQGAGSGSGSSGNVDLKLFYPVQVAGNLANIIGRLCDEFNASHPNIKVEPIYSGDYGQTLQRVITGHNSGNAGDIALLSISGLWQVMEEKAIIPLTDLIAAEGGSAFTGRFWPGYMTDCTVDGVIYGIPFQKSVLLFYYNKDMFKEAGLDPERPPATWAELKDYARKLTVKRNGQTERFGVAIDTGSWGMSNYILQNGGKLQNSRGNEVYFNTPEVIGAIEFVKDFIDQGLSPAAGSSGGSAADFVAGASAMMYNSSGSLSFVRDSATFNWGAAPLPINTTKSGTTGGGQFVIPSASSPEKQKASWEFIKWITTVERAAQWCIDTGYIATQPGAFDTPALRNYAQSFPQILAARAQLEGALPEYGACHSGAQIGMIIADSLSGIFTGELGIRDALSTAQADIDKLLAIWK